MTRTLKKTVRWMIKDLETIETCGETERLLKFYLREIKEMKKTNKGKYKRLRK